MIDCCKYIEFARRITPFGLRFMIFL